MANRIFELPETKGTFQVRGVVKGTEKPNFYTEKKTKTGKDFRIINFGCEYDDKKSLYLDLSGTPHANVYFSKKDDQTGKFVTKSVPWAMRETFNEDGFNMIGVRLGLNKVVNADGKKENEKKTMHAFDACDYIADNLSDDSSVFIKGNVEYSSYMDKNGDIRRRQKLVPNQISLCQDVTFEDYDEDHKPTHDFTQNIVFTGIEQETENGKATGRFVVSAKIVTYNNIVNAEFVTTNSKLATNMKKNLKPYNSLTVFGNIEVVHAIEEVEEDDGWGEPNPMEMVSAPSKVEYVIIGANPKSIDKETYTEANVTEAISKIRNSQMAENNFSGSTAAASSGDGWFDDDSDDDPWG